MTKVVKLAACLALAAMSLPAAAQRTPAKPPKPSETIPRLADSRPIILCGDCDKPFDTSTHKKVLEGLVANKYLGELRKALYWQDSLHQFESKAHFDNCDFDGATSYIDSLLAEVEGHVVAAKAAKEKSDAAGVQAQVLEAFFALGQALHGVQDFYAHTNYVEMSVGAARKSTDIEVVMPWKESGRKRIAELTGKGLVSGFVLWGTPQKCKAGAVSHGEMAKDKADTTSGKVKIAQLENRSRYQIAAQLAREASQEFIDDAFRRWPLLKEINGENVAFEVLVDRRGL